MRCMVLVLTFAVDFEVYNISYIATSNCSSTQHSDLTDMLPTSPSDLPGNIDIAIADHDAFQI